MELNEDENNWNTINFEKLGFQNDDKNTKDLL
jgi:hypothetical protein